MNLYLVHLPRGKSNPNWKKFYENVHMNLNGRYGDYGGVQAHLVVKHRMDADTVKLLSKSGFRRVPSEDMLEVEEITLESLKDYASGHRVFIQTVRGFLKEDDFPSIGTVDDIDELINNDDI